MDPNTYIASNETQDPFFCEENTYIASNAQTVLISNEIISIPLSVFSNGLSSLEAATKFLKETKNLRFCDIARLLNRDDRTIWDAYSNAQKSGCVALPTESTHSIPTSVFSDREFSMLELLTRYLKEECNMRLCKIALLLNKDARTIWTVYSRIKTKRKNANKQ